MNQRNAPLGSHSRSESPPLKTATAHPRVPLQHVRGALGRTLAQIQSQPQPPRSHYDYVDPSTGVVDWSSAGYDTQLEESHEVRMSTQLAQNLVQYLDGDWDSDNDFEERSQLDNSSQSDSALLTFMPFKDSEVPYVAGRQSRKVDPEATESPWFPWPDKEKQNTAIHWAMLALGLKDLPSDRVMDDIDKALQKMCGIQSIRYSGKLGHIYYVNDLAAIIAQEMANPTTRTNLHFFPEDSGPALSQAWQASRWLDELNSDLTTPMIRIHKQDFYIHEPTLLSNGVIYLNSGWVIEGDTEFELCESDLVVSFPLLVQSFLNRKKTDPRIITGIQCNGKLAKWTKTNPSEGNRWRKLSAGHRVLAFPVWLYCDDTSGNTSKKWNKHNSFLFTAAGLPRKFVHRESNIHFLSTSNVAPPLEMLDGIVEQLEECQKRGIWAWDAEYQELVLVIPSVLAMLGDNPCKGEPEEENEDDAGSDASSVSSTASEQLGKKKKKTKKKDESVNEMISRITQFLTRQNHGPAKKPFTTASIVGGQATFKRQKTASGIKDTFQGAFLDRIFAIASKKGRTRVAKQVDVNSLINTFPKDITSPVWRIKDLDPHQDTPVEILHVILLGFVKYFWRDAIARVKKSEKETLISRLSSFNVSGLGVSSLAGSTLVNYAGSLTGRDFRIIVQAAPFVLQGLLPEPYIELWTSLSAVVTLVWQPEIPDFQMQLDSAIKHFLDCTCGVTLQWFNKPKFHVILHLPAHIRRFGPAMLFATEGFESFNAIIRSASVHSNRHAPSLDIATRMAKGNRVRHLLSQGFFPSNRDLQAPLAENQSSEPQLKKPPLKPPSESPWMGISLEELKCCKWTRAGNSPLQFMSLNSFGSRLLGWEPNSEAEFSPGLCEKIGPVQAWTATKSAAVGIHSNAPRVFTPAAVTLINGDTCSVGDWVVWVDSTAHSKISRIGCVAEIIQFAGSAAQQAGKADSLLLSRTIIGEVHGIYKMHRLQPIPNEYCQVEIKDVKCTINIQHNCADNNCRSARTRIILNEREETSERSLAIQHISSSDLIINTAQMRDAAALDAFRWQPSTLDTAIIVRLAAEKMHSERQKQKKSVETVEDEAAELENLTADLEPAQKRSRLNLPSTPMGQSNSPAPFVQQSSAQRVRAPHHETQNNPGFPGLVPRAYHFSNTFQSSFQSQ
ncbi:hypothetical protein B0H19DRAFT_1086555 [Mycena capillaripes]|nr:hypothetical protein B0H19DRAFT_1086555 [Mycena capillaripes]